jgi:two-component system, OmpR family, phosphate regulon sensor histidine kinase PhoR
LHDAAVIVIFVLLLVVTALFVLSNVTVNDLRTKLAVSDRMLAEEQDRYLVSSRRWLALLNATQDPVLLVKSDGQCLIANQAALAIFPDMEGSLLLNLSQSSELSSFARSIAYESKADIAAIGEFILPKPSERVIQAVAYPTGDNSTILILRDLTDLRRLETVRRDFVANVSHELRTPLSSVKAMAETLIDGAIDDTEVARHFLETIVHESDRLVRLSADLLDLSRVESQPAQKKIKDVTKIVQNVTAGYAAQLKAAGHNVVINMEQPLLLDVDPDEISQVMVNLVDNAIKYTPNSGTIRIWSTVSDDLVTISVSDTGIGILQQDLPRIFERFYRTDKARSRASGGTGLGLSIVKHIVERHGGKVSVESEYNHGSTFSFTLPVPSRIVSTLAKSLTSPTTAN